MDLGSSSKEGRQLLLDGLLWATFGERGLKNCRVKAGRWMGIFQIRKSGIVVVLWTDMKFLLQQRDFVCAQGWLSMYWSVLTGACWSSCHSSVPVVTGEIDLLVGEPYYLLKTETIVDLRNSSKEPNFFKSLHKTRQTELCDWFWEKISCHSLDSGNRG